MKTEASQVQDLKLHSENHLTDLQTQGIFKNLIDFHLNQIKWLKLLLKGIILYNILQSSFKTRNKLYH